MSTLNARAARPPAPSASTRAPTSPASASSATCTRSPAPAASRPRSMRPPSQPSPDARSCWPTGRRCRAAATATAPTRTDSRSGPTTCPPGVAASPATRPPPAACSRRRPRTAPQRPLARSSADSSTDRRAQSPYADTRWEWPGPVPRRSSKPVRRGSPTLGRFDSFATPLRDDAVDADRTQVVRLPRPRVVGSCRRGRYLLQRLHLGGAEPRKARTRRPARGPTASGESRGCRAPEARHRSRAARRRMAVFDGSPPPRHWPHGHSRVGPAAHRRRQHPRTASAARPHTVFIPRSVAPGSPPESLGDPTSSSLRPSD